MKQVITISWVFVSLLVFGQKKIAIVGGGISGVSTAHELLKKDPTLQITLFEKREVLGGNARSFKTTNLYGDSIYVDMGPQYFAEGDWEIGPWDNYVSLLKEYQLYDTALINTFDGTIVVKNNVDLKPDFVSPKNGKWRGESLGQLLRFFKLYKRAKKIYWEKNQDYEKDIESWIEEMPLKDSFKIKVAYPFLAASLGPTVETIKKADTKEMSKIVAFGRSEFKVLDLGMGTMIQKIGSELIKKGLKVELNSQVNRIHLEEGKVVISVNNSELEFDEVVLAVHADQAKQLMNADSKCQYIVESLEPLTYFKAHIVLHRDSSYACLDKPAFLNVFTDKKDFSVTSSTMNLSQIDKKYAGLFKSWLSDADYQKVKKNGSFLHEETFWHPDLTAGWVELTNKMKLKLKELKIIHIAGGWTEGLETQESAIASGKRVAGEILD